MSVADRGRPVASCSEWHGDGTAGEHERATHLIVRHQLGRWVRPVQVDTSLVGKRPEGARQLVLRQQPSDKGILRRGVRLPIPGVLIGKVALQVGVGCSGLRVGPQPFPERQVSAPLRVAVG